jgi:hypothetical protein
MQSPRQSDGIQSRHKASLILAFELFLHLHMYAAIFHHSHSVVHSRPSKSRPVALIQSAPPHHDAEPLSGHGLGVRPPLDSSSALTTSISSSEGSTSAGFGPGEPQGSAVSRVVLPCGELLSARVFENGCRMWFLRDKPQILLQAVAHRS